MGALTERERLDEQEAFTHLRRAARSSGRKLSAVAAEVAAGLPLPWPGERGPWAGPIVRPTRDDDPRFASGSD
jgi:ANTAR domain-containing protein